MAAENDDLWEWDDPEVCMKHLRFVPCRRCLYDEADGGAHWNSTAPEDVETVRRHQQQA